ncbi:MAG: hypothetical protein L6R42_008892 [Xanthoria sp. 1 TBL-2021]|nr:MAG: hypothetical protein L6R42_008892 [Xanthoria sp. 1 TBL-2021]
MARWGLMVFAIRRYACLSLPTPQTPPSNGDESVAFVNSSTTEAAESLATAIEGNAMYCANPANLLFNDLPPASASSRVSKLQCQPSSGWDDVVDYVGWKDVHSAYLICEQDAALPPEMQKQIAERAGSEIETFNARYCCMIGQPERVVEVVEMAAGECA